MSDMTRRQFDSELSQKLQSQFFAEPRQAGEQFWTTREIMQRFRVSRYAAQRAVLELMRRQVLERSPRVGTFVAACSTRPVQPGAAHLGVLLAAWAAES